MNYYSGYIAAYYDLFFPAVDIEELDFYAQQVASCPQPALEIGCGTGRIMLELLKQGFAVEGADNAPEMLALCKQKGLQEGLEPMLHEQSMQDLSLPKKYGCIYSPLGTFQQLVDRADAQNSLQRFYEHLLTDGKLIVYLYVPWHNAPEFGQWHAHDPICNEDIEIRVQEKSIHDPMQQLVFSTYRYAITQQGETTAQEHELVTRWYSRYEFTMMLQQAGFADICVSAGYADNGPFDVMIFQAQK